MDTNIGVGQNSLVLTSIASSSIQRYYFTCFASDPLSGITSITAQTWNYNFAIAESAINANFPVNGASQPVRVTCYVWRPSTQTKVGNILDGNSASTVTEPAAATIRSQEATFTGSLVSGVQDGDVICFEVWFEITQSQVVAFTDTFYFDGTTVTAGGSTVANHASYIETPQNLTFGAAVTGTRLYFHAQGNALANLPTTEQSSLTANSGLPQTINRSMNTMIGTGNHVTMLFKSTATVSLQRIYYGRFVSPPLSGITSITAQTWTYNFATQEGNASANFPVSGASQVVRVMCYVWRPGTGKVGDILDGNSAATLTETTSAVSYTTTFTGSLVSGVQTGDVICFEVWFEITQALANAYTNNFFYDGNTTTYAGGVAVFNHASFIETPQNLTFGTEVLNTRLYFHAANSGLSNLPTTDQSSFTAGVTVDAFTVNRSMNQTKGTSQTSLAATTLAQTAQQYIYFTRFVSEPLSGETSIKAGNYAHSIAYAESDLNADFPGSAANVAYITCYVWRPSTQTKVGTIYDTFTDVNGILLREPSSLSTEIAGYTEFAGAVVNSVQDGDVIVFEVWFSPTQTSAISYTDTIYFDGTTVTLCAGSSAQAATVSSHASFVECSDNLTFSITTAVSQTYTHIYKLRALSTQSYTHKYKLRKLGTQSYTHKYKIRKLATQTYTHKYKLRALINQIFTHKYKLRKLVTQTFTHIYKILQLATTVAQTFTHKYNIKKLVSPVGSDSVVQLDGVNDYINAGDDSALWSQALTKFSFSFWFKISAKDCYLASHHWNVGGSFILLVTNSTKQISFFIQRSDITAITADTATNAFVPDTWQHVACVYDSTLGSANIKIYLDGTVGTGTGNLTETLNTTGALQIGHTDSLTPQGYVKDFRWWTTKALTSTEVTDVRNDAGTAPAPNYWLKMNEGTGNPVDTITGTKTGTLTNGATWLTGLGGWTHRYKIRKLVNQQYTHLYKLRKLIAGTYTHKYKIVGRIAQTYTHIYKLRKLANQTYTHKYNIKKLISQTYTHRYKLRKLVNQTYTHLYKIRKLINQTFTHKYKLRKLATQIFTHKYKLRQLVPERLCYYHPLYMYPNWWIGTPYNWTPVITTANANPNTLIFLVLNVDSGPGTSINTDYSDHGIPDLKGVTNHNIKILGYVSTLYGDISIVTVKDNIQKWYDFYGESNIDGIMLDQMEDDTGDETYYSDITAYVKSISPRAMVVANPGKNVAESYVNTVDKIIVWENDAIVPNESTIQAYTFYPTYPRNKFLINVLNISESAALDLTYLNMIKKYVFALGFTDDVLPNPYDTIPAYFNQIVALLVVLGSYTHKYKLVGRIAQIYTHRYNIKKLINQTYTHKYKLRKLAGQTFTHIYNILQLAGTATQTYTHRYKIRKLTTQTYTHKYNVKKLINQSFTHKYGLKKLVGSAGAIQLDGVNDYLNCGNDATLWSGTLTKFSFSLWIYSSTSIAASALILDHNSNNPQSFVVYNSTVGTAITFRIVKNDTTQVNCTASGLPSIIDRWVHLVCTYDSTLGTQNMKFYVDGVRTGNQPNVNETLTSSSILTLAGAVNDHRGYMKDFRFWNSQALTQTDVNNIFNNLPAAPAANYWLKMDEGNGNPVDTISGTKTATLTNGALWTSLGWTHRYKMVGRAIQTYTHRYKLRQLANQTYTHKYNIKKLISQTYIHRYRIKTLIAQIFTHRYRLRQLAGQIFTHKYNIKKIATQNYIHIYRIAGRTTQIYTHRYKLRQLTSQTFTHRYKLRQLVNKTYTHIYRIKKLVNQTYTHKYKLRQLAGRSFTHIYNILQLAGTATQAYTHRYRIRKLTTQTYTHRYNIKKLIARNYTHVYKIVGRAVQSYTHRYKMVGRATAVYTHRYNIKKLVSQLQTHRYKIRQITSKTFTHRYKLRQLGSQVFTHRYNIKQKVASQFLHIYNIKQLASKTFTHRYKLRQVASKVFTHIYNIIGRISQIFTHIYRIRVSYDTTNTDISLILTKWLQETWTENPYSTVEFPLIPPKSKITFGQRFELTAGSHSDMHIHVRNVTENPNFVINDATIQENADIANIYVEVRYIPEVPKFGTDSPAPPSNMMWQIRAYIDELLRSDPEQLTGAGIDVISIIQEIPDSNTPPDVHAQSAIEQIYTIIFTVKVYYSFLIDRVS